MGQQDIFFTNESSKSNQEFPPVPLLLVTAMCQSLPCCYCELLSEVLPPSTCPISKDGMRWTGSALEGIYSLTTFALAFSESGCFSSQEK